MSWFSRLKNTIHPAALERELADEMKDHLERRVASLREPGLSADEAARQAALRFGNPMLRREECRDIRSWAVLDSVLQDARYGCRMMFRNSAFAVTAVLSLTLAIGRIQQFFRLWMRPCCTPCRCHNRNGCLHSRRPTSNNPEPSRSESENPSAIRFTCGSALRREAWRAWRSSVFPLRREARISGATAPLEHVITQLVSGEAFQILGVRPALDILFSAKEDRTPGSYPFAVLSYEFWASAQ